MVAVTICSDFGAPKKSDTVSSSISHEVVGPDDLSFLNVELKPTFSLSSFTFIKRLFSSSLSALLNVSNYRNKVYSTTLCLFMRHLSNSIDVPM